MLKTRIALLPWLVIFAVLIETGDSEPRPVCRRLTGLGVERGGKGEGVGKHRAIALEVIAGGAVSIGPQAHGLIADELRYPYRLINSGILRGVAMDLVLKNQHCACLSLSFLLY